MSGIRRFRRNRASSRKRQETPKRFLLRHFVLVGGAVLAILGAAWSGQDYHIYLVGRPEQVRNTRLGTEYLPEVPPGDPGRRASAYAGLGAAGAGVALVAFALVVSVMDRKLAARARGDGAEAVSARRL